MTNYEELFQDQMKDPQFAKAYLDARLERLVMEFLENLKEKISQNGNPSVTCGRTAAFRGKGFPRRMASPG